MTGQETKLKDSSVHNLQCSCFLEVDGFKFVLYKGAGGNRCIVCSIRSFQEVAQRLQYLV